MRDQANKPFARNLRHRQTDAETLLWHHLRSRNFQKIKFRRQHPVGPYIIDFCSLEIWLVVELDGGQHALNRPKDEKRTHYLQQAGFRVVRFWDHEVFQMIDAVLERIQQKTQETPSPRPCLEPRLPVEARD
jgi:adenine-specific DNA-methyltransferase